MGRISGKTRGVGELRAKFCGRSMRSSRPYRDKGTATAIAKFPDDIKAILIKPETERSLLERQIGALAFRQIAYEHGQVPLLLKGEVKARWDELHKGLKNYDAMRPDPPPPVMTATDLGPVSPPTVVPGGRKKESIEPGFLSVLDPAGARSSRRRAAPQSTGRRLALARWLSRPDNPLSTRVIVNRVWQYHFGRGLAGTPSDFGRMGEPPVIPSCSIGWRRNLSRGGWRLKPLHRLILTSAAYRQAPARNSHDLAAGPANRSRKSLALETDRRTAGRRGNSRRHAGRQWRARFGIGGPSVPDLATPTHCSSRESSATHVI